MGRKNRHGKKDHKKGGGVHSITAAQGPEAVHELLAAGKGKDAVKAAKILYRDHECEAHRELLLKAYTLRLTEMTAKNLFEEAAALLDVIALRFPESANPQTNVRALSFIRGGRLSEWVSPLADPECAESTRQQIEDGLATCLTRPALLAEASTLPPDHPLRVQAAATAAAFTAVTSGPVTSETISLPEIPRRSPLAPWKLLIRTLYHLYRREDEEALTAAAKIPAGSAPATLLPTLHSVLKTGESQGRSSDLVAAIKGETQGLPALLNDLDKALKGNDERRLGRAIDATLKAADPLGEELLNTIRCHLSIRGSIYGWEATVLRSLMKTPPRRDEQYWLLAARANEELARRDDPTDIFRSSLMYAEYLWHATITGIIGASGPERAALLLRIANLLKCIPPDIRSQAVVAYKKQDYGFFDGYYDNQPSEIRQRQQPKELLCQFLDLNAVYEMAVKSDPTSGSYLAWYETAVQEITESGSTKQIVAKGALRRESILLAWNNALPRDVFPWLKLAEEAESSGSLEKAKGYIEQVLALDGLNAEADRTRMRLLAKRTLELMKKKLKHRGSLMADLCRELLTGPCTDPVIFAPICLALRWCVDDPEQKEKIVQTLIGGEGRYYPFVPDQKTLQTRLFEPAKSSDLSLIENFDASMATWRENLRLRDLDPAAVARCLIKAMAAYAKVVMAPQGKACAPALPEPTTPTPPVEIPRLLAAVFMQLKSAQFELSLHKEFFDQALKPLKKSSCGLTPLELIALAEAAKRAGNLETVFQASRWGLSGEEAYLPHFLLLRLDSLQKTHDDRRREAIIEAAEIIAHKCGDTSMVSRIRDRLRSENPPFNFNERGETEMRRSFLKGAEKTVVAQEAKVKIFPKINTFLPESYFRRLVPKPNHFTRNFFRDFKIDPRDFFANFFDDEDE